MSDSAIYQRKILVHLTVITDIAEFAQIMDDSVVPWRVKIKSTFFALEVGDYLFDEDNYVRARSTGLHIGETLAQAGQLSTFLEGIDIMSS